jgi:hypothetical protein
MLERLPSFAPRGSLGETPDGKAVTPSRLYMRWLENLLDRVRENSVQALGLSWIDYIAGWASEPTFIENNGSGDVWEYTYADTTLYRYIANDGSEDALYSSYTAPNLLDLVIKRIVEV